MTAIIIPKPFRKLLIIGPIYDKMEKLSQIEKIIPQYDWIIFNGGLCYPDNNVLQIKQYIERMNKLILKGKVIYLVGKSDYLLLNRLRESWLEKWINKCPNIAIANFPNHNIIIVDGGIPPNIKSQQELLNNLEASFISQINGKPWHQNYDGVLGYVISNNPLGKERPHYYKYSMQLGISYEENAPLYAQEVDEIGLKKTISI